MSWEHTFTVFTPTYNRAHTLLRVYASLCAQTFRDFEWLIVDDGSSDGTRELVAQWQSEAPFAIRYQWQENRGMHFAHNRAVKAARGLLYVKLDSDDECIPTALERLLAQWNGIAPERQEEFAGIWCLTMSPDGVITGRPFPADIVETTWLKMQYRLRLHGEKWMMARTDVLRAYPYPEPSGSRGYYPESLVWSRVGGDYLLRFVNEPLRIYHQGHSSLMTSGRHSVQGRRRAAPGAALQYMQVLNEHIDYLHAAPRQFLMASIQFVRFSFHKGDNILLQRRGLQNRRARLLHLVGIGPGWLAYRRDLRRGARESVSGGASSTELLSS